METKWRLITELNVFYDVFLWLSRLCQNLVREELNGFVKEHFKFQNIFGQ